MSDLKDTTCQDEPSKYHTIEFDEEDWNVTQRNVATQATQQGGTAPTGIGNQVGQIMSPLPPRTLWDKLGQDGNNQGTPMQSGKTIQTPNISQRPVTRSQLAKTRSLKAKAKSRK